MLKIHHRVNSSSNLAEIEKTHGVEIDLRSWGNTIIVTHDVFTEAEDLKSWLRSYDHELLILNTKEEGLEEEILKTIHDVGVEAFFFLDQSFPYLVRTLKSGETRTAVRMSDFESSTTATQLKIRPDWVWVDSFSGDWQHLLIHAKELKQLGYRLCVASPELHGRQSSEEFGHLKSIVSELGFNIDAVCTKVPHLW